MDHVTSSCVSELLADLNPQNCTTKKWYKWIELVSHQRLLQSCYILESGQKLLGRSTRPALNRVDVSFPASLSLWNAAHLLDWLEATQTTKHMPRYVSEVQDHSQGLFDSFQTSFIIAASGLIPLEGCNLDLRQFDVVKHQHDISPSSRYQLLTTKLLFHIPVRPLLAVAGESWILTAKVPSMVQFSDLKTELEIWTDGLWPTTKNVEERTPIKIALGLAINILRHVGSEDFDMPLRFGGELGLYYAALVIWATTKKSLSRMEDMKDYEPIGKGIPGASNAVVSSDGYLADDNSRIVYERALNNYNSEVALLESVNLWPLNIPRWCQDNITILRFVRARICQSMNQHHLSPSEEHDQFGELVDCIVANLTRLIAQGSVRQPTNTTPIEKGKAAYLKEKELRLNRLATSKASIIKDLKVVKQEDDESSDMKVKREEEDQGNRLGISTASDRPSRSSYIIKRRASSDPEQSPEAQPPVKCNERTDGSQQTGSRLLDIKSSLQHSAEGELEIISGDSPAGWSCDSEQWTEGSFSETESPRQGSTDSASVSKAADFLFKEFQIWNESQDFHRRDQKSNDRSSGLNNVAYNGTNNSASYSEPVTCPQQATTTQKRTSDEDDDEHKSSKRRKISDAADDSDNRLLACPFANNNPLVHRRCFRYVLQDVGRLK
jgi:hypothetical protein